MSMPSCPTCGQRAFAMTETQVTASILLLEGEEGPRRHSRLPTTTTLMFCIPCGAAISEDLQRTILGYFPRP